MLGRFFADHSKSIMLGLSVLGQAVVLSTLNKPKTPKETNQGTKTIPKQSNTTEANNHKAQATQNPSKTPSSFFTFKLPVSELTQKVQPDKDNSYQLMLHR